jgi:predicted HNH restriction endonuclease
MDIEIKLEDKQLEIDKIKFQKMVFLFNALDNGWSIKKRKDSYIFTKNHEGKKETYLAIFMKDNTDINKLLT